MEGTKYLGYQTNLYYTTSETFPSGAVETAIELGWFYSSPNPNEPNTYIKRESNGGDPMSTPHPGW